MKRVKWRLGARASRRGWATKGSGDPSSIGYQPLSDMTLSAGDIGMSRRRLLFYSCVSINQQPAASPGSTGSFLKWQVVARGIFCVGVARNRRWPRRASSTWPAATLVASCMWAGDGPKCVAARNAAEKLARDIGWRALAWLSLVSFGMAAERRPSCMHGLRGVSPLFLSRRNNDGVAWHAILRRPW